MGSKSEGSISYDTSRSSRGGCSVLFGGKKIRSRENSDEPWSGGGE